MQKNKKAYNAKDDEIFKAITIREPWASKIISGEKTVEIRSRNYSYRGDLIICSGVMPYSKHSSGSVLGRVDFYKTKPVEEFTKGDWAATGILAERQSQYTGYGLFFRNPKKIIELPVKGQAGLWNLVFGKGEIMEYPEYYRDFEDETYMHRTPSVPEMRLKIMGIVLFGVAVIILISALLWKLLPLI